MIGVLAGLTTIRTMDVPRLVIIICPYYPEASVDVKTNSNAFLSIAS